MGVGLFCEICSVRGPLVWLAGRVARIEGIRTSALKIILLALCRRRPRGVKKKGVSETGPLPFFFFLPSFLAFFSFRWS